MSSSEQLSGEAAGLRLDPAVARAFARFSGGFWKGETSRTAWLLTCGLASFLLLSLAVTVGLNRWNRWFFDALERKDAETAAIAVLVFAGIIAAMAAIGVGIVLTRETLQVRWRAWIVGRLLDTWLVRDRYYHLSVTHTEPANPEYRIADDTRWATEPLVDLAIGLFSALTGAAAFISILWTVGGSLHVEVGGAQLAVPAYMVIAALAYGAIMSGLMLYVGRPLVSCFARKNEAEGIFRFALMRLRENSESIALLRGAASEKQNFTAAYDTVVARWLAIVRQHGRLTWITNSSGPMIPIVPLFFAAPKYFSGELSLGEVTQLAGAFVQVQMAISWLVDNYNRIAECYASARRVMVLADACEVIDEAQAAVKDTGIAAAASADAALHLAGVSVFDPAGRPLVNSASLSIAGGERIAITGNSSTGKTALVRVIAGLWPWGRGRIETPRNLKIMVAPQKPYMPMGTLRAALLYPFTGQPVGDDRLMEVLTSTGLQHLAHRLGEEDRWDQILGSGERQRIAVARILLHNPDVVVIDDSLSALEAEAQSALLDLITAELPHAAVLTLGQRERTERAYERRLTLETRSGGSILRATADASVS
jgi:vitamin B12/bleomycin/antimicrobial peptide transport system ATP-binding/permease protein